MQIVHTPRRLSRPLYGLGNTPVAVNPSPGDILADPAGAVTRALQQDFDFVRIHFATGNKLDKLVPEGVPVISLAFKSFISNDLQRGFYALAKKRLASLDASLKTLEDAAFKEKEAALKRARANRTSANAVAYEKAKQRWEAFGVTRKDFSGSAVKPQLDYLQKLGVLPKTWQTNLDRLNVEFASIPLTLDGIPKLDELRKKISLEAGKGNITSEAAAALAGQIDARKKEIEKPPSEEKLETDLVLRAESMPLEQLLATIAKAPAALAAQLQEVYDRRKAEEDKKLEDAKKKKLMMFAGVGLVAVLILFARRKSA